MSKSRFSLSRGIHSFSRIVQCLRTFVLHLYWRRRLFFFFSYRANNKKEYSRWTHWQNVQLNLIDGEEQWHILSAVAVGSVATISLRRRARNSQLTLLCVVSKYLSKWESGLRHERRRWRILRSWSSSTENFAKEFETNWILAPSKDMTYWQFSSTKEWSVSCLEQFFLNWHFLSIVTRDVTVFLMPWIMFT